MMIYLSIGCIHVSERSCGEVDGNYANMYLSKEMGLYDAMVLGLISGTVGQIVVTSSDWQLFDRVRSMDIRLLKACSVGVIVDLMMEKKKVKFGM